MSKLSAGLVLGDLNDFIAPSQACIKPTSSAPKDTGEYVVKKDDDQKAKEAKKATINLADCLACSGCITSAETVLITLQSQEEVYRILKENALCMEKRELENVYDVVVSISPQSRAAFAAKYDCSLAQVHKKLAHFFCEYLSKKFSYGEERTRFMFVDTSIARTFSLMETAKEFMGRVEKNKNLPLLTSACPGWICYAEKSQSKDIIDLISSARSPQQVTGALVKRLDTVLNSDLSRKIYHLSIMPCFDKKLEASREEFTLGGEKDVDCVLSTVELERMIYEEGLDFRQLPEAADFTDLMGDSDSFGSTGSTSGGYLDFTLQYAKEKLFGNAEFVEVITKTGKNSDYVEYILNVNTEPKLRFARAYGFRNIQNIVRKLKQPKRKNEIPLHFVEIMACPSGCINGGGQLKPTNDDKTVSIGAMKEFVKKMENMYYSVESKLDPKEGIIHNGKVLEMPSELLHTTYKSVNETQKQESLNINW